MKKYKNKGFTLAEIIIAMTIIGVVAAITIPALLVSTNEKAMEAQKKALHARMAQSISQIEDMRTFKTTAGSSALNFITKGLSKVYRITKTCDKNNLTTSCSFPDEISTQDGGTFKIAEKTTLVDYIANGSVTEDMLGLNTQVAGFKTANGESIALFYNPNCRGSKTNSFYKGSAATAMCLNMIYDLNGKDNAPNEVGKDVGFISVFFPKDSDIALPVTHSEDAEGTIGSYEDAIALCKNQKPDLIVPTWEEGMSIALNKALSSVSPSQYLVSGSGATGTVYLMDVSTLIPDDTGSWGSAALRCIYNN